MLASLAGQVYSIERIAGSRARGAQARIRLLGIFNATVKCFDGTLGWSANAPYDAILVAAGGPEIRRCRSFRSLRSVAGWCFRHGETREAQRLMRVIKTENGRDVEDHGVCAFVPLIGRWYWSDQKNYYLNPVQKLNAGHENMDSLSEILHFSISTRRTLNF
ncbi:MAG: hypothetical protein WKF84_01010 [Pyrinomonadaceae bacterium]